MTTSPPMVDAEERVRGAVRYALNFELPGMLHARIVRSTHAHARIRAIDTSLAERVPGVAAVISGQDLRGPDGRVPRYGPIILDQTPFAVDKVRCIGEAVAAVAAEDEDAAQEAAGLIEVEYEELPAVFDPEEALRPGAPVVNEGPREVAPGWSAVKERSRAGTNIVHHWKQRRGDVTEAFQRAAVVVENVFSGPAVAHVTLEPHVAVAEARGPLLTVWTAHQSPHALRKVLAEAFDKPLADVRIVVFTLGGGFGGKSNPKLEPIAALLAMKAGRPVKIVLPRSEVFLTHTQHACRVALKTAVSGEGDILAQESRCYFDSGPIADITPTLISRAYAATGPYRVGAVRSDSYGVYTNNLPATAFRGFGVTQVAWAHEAQMDIIADRLGIDPLELRRRNVLRTGDAFSTGEPMPEMHYTELLDEAARQVGWHEGPLAVRSGHTIRAKGIVSIVKGLSAPMTSSASVKLNADGSLDLLTSTVEIGQGAKTVLTQIAAAEAGVAVERVRVSEPDTSYTPFDQLTAASSSTHRMGTAITYAAEDLKSQLADLAMERLEVAREDLVFESGRVAVRGAPSSSVSYVDLMAGAQSPSLQGSGTFVAKFAQDGSLVRLDPETGQGYGSVQWHPGVVSCEVEVDTDTGKVKVLRLHAGLYVGRVVNQRLAELQVEGSVTMALGQALFEELVSDGGGQVSNANLADYMIASIKDVPRISVQLLESADRAELHGLGETALPAVRPAIANAVCRAIGVRIFDLPITPEKVLKALSSRPETSRS